MDKGMRPLPQDEETLHIAATLSGHCSAQWTHRCKEVDVGDVLLRVVLGVGHRAVLQVARGREMARPTQEKSGQQSTRQGPHEIHAMHTPSR